MIGVSSISEFLYCPVKLYLKHSHGDMVQTQEMLTGKMIQEALRGFEEITKRNIWQIKQKLELDELFDALFYEVPEFIEDKLDKYGKNMDPHLFEDLIDEIMDDFRLQSHLMAFKIKKIQKITGKKGNEISEMLFPQSLLEFPFQNKELNLRGVINKIEIINGIYYPVEIKTGIPPSNGVWYSDELQIAAYAMLMDYELNKEVLVGFVEYTKIGERRPVVINSYLQGKLLKVLDNINIMFEREEIPEFKIYKNKCQKCEYMEICDYCS